jgi:hypothetical protein|tara:strand:+ start:9746 stop:10729 length:984 start_codon:yes stop_codon:yes gene_type:complete
VFEQGAQQFIMLEKLKFVKGAVATRDFIPALTHFLIRDGRVTGCNGAMSLSSPIDMDVDVAPNAKQFIKAIDACSETISMIINKKGRLIVSSGAFKTFIDCIDSNTIPEFTVSGEVTELTRPILPALKTLEPFVSQDTNRPWSCAVLFKEGAAYSTNNITVLQYWLGYSFPKTMTVPYIAIKELLRIGLEPVSFQMDAKQITFHYEDGKRLTTILQLQEWPDINKLLSRQNDAIQIDPNLFKSLEEIKPFLEFNRRVYFNEGNVSTTPDDETGTIITTPASPGKGCYNLDQLLLINKVANRFDFRSYPDPCYFYGDKLRGMIVGIML